ncbi:N-acetylmuramate alpha-1-phosphate uridylyltransferase MurU [Paenalcaligenes suwonensis]|uniref:N-acetylmuramate alpha-1-phosphate uridylyltransferase MurU n=1 Tax=Paenalcaligenes suwonensis TaxID=1202713 RepID=UPI0014077D39|nr:nucleotidyltransferase family protein [Paenalcaligenes suwonensis]NHC62626.1 nucleotidyltransferase family protein [Paenalcaligenes suwonensis]
MKAMILAAGRGERMRPLTDHCPKPLLRAGKHSLIEWHILRLQRAGITDIVINHAWLGEKIEAALGDGSQLGVHIQYSPENPALETAGGIRQALPLLGDSPFLIINGDVFTDWDAQHAFAAAKALDDSDRLAHLWMVENPEHNLKGDFYLQAPSQLLSEHPLTISDKPLTYSGIGCYKPALFSALPVGQPAPLGPLLRQAMSQQHISGEALQSTWTDVGTPERLEKISSQLGALE